MFFGCHSESLSSHSLKRIRVFIINYLGFTKTEANATIVLIGIVLIFAIAPRVYFQYAFTTTDTSLEDRRLLSEWLVDIEKKIALKPKKSPPSKNIVKPFPFDPNKIPVADLNRLGFRPYVSKRIVKYREAGGKFKSGKDLKKIFGIDTTLVVSLETYMTFPKSKPVVKLEPPKEKSVEKKVIAKEKIWLDINLASAEELQEIRGIGPFYANNIIEYRDKLGGFYQYDQLKEVYKMKVDIIDLLKNHTFFQAAPKRNLSINTDSMKFIARHPYLSWNHAKVIFSYRKQHGQFKEPSDLLQIKIIDDSLYQKISPYISVEP